MLQFLLVFLMLQSTAFANNLLDASYYTVQSAQREGTSGVWTANGEKFHEDRQTCAHPRYPFGSILKITNPKNGRWYECRVNDRGPAAWTGHEIDLTPQGFKLLGIPEKQGIAQLRVERKR